MRCDPVAKFSLFLRSTMQDDRNSEDDSQVQFNLGGARPKEQGPLDDTVRVSDSGVGPSRMSSTPATARRRESEDLGLEEEAALLEETAAKLRRDAARLTEHGYSQLSTIRRSPSDRVSDGQDGSETGRTSGGELGQLEPLAATGGVSVNHARIRERLERCNLENELTLGHVMNRERPWEWRGPAIPVQDRSGFNPISDRGPTLSGEIPHQLGAGRGVLSQTRPRAHLALGSRDAAGRDDPVSEFGGNGLFESPGSADRREGYSEAQVRPPGQGILGPRARRVWTDAEVSGPVGASSRDLVGADHRRGYSEAQTAGGGYLEAQATGGDHPQREYLDHRKRNKKAPSFDGKVSFNDFLIQFELVAGINRWSRREMAAELATSLTGPAIMVLGTLSPEQRGSYEELVLALQKRFEPAYQGKLVKTQLRTRRRKRGESLDELAEEIKRDVRRAYPTIQESVLWDGMAQDVFTEAVEDEQMQLYINSGNPASLEEALERAMAYEIHKKKNGQRRGDRVAIATAGEGEQKIAIASGPCDTCGHACPRSGRPLPGLAMGQNGNGMQQGMRMQNGMPPRGARVPLCYSCGQAGHYRSQCPARQHYPAPPRPTTPAPGQNGELQGNLH